MSFGGRLLWLVVVVTVVAVALWLFSPAGGDDEAFRDVLREFWGVEERGDDEDDDDVASRVELVAGRPVVRLSEAQRRASGIGTEPLAAYTLLPEIGARGRVTDVSPLLALRAAISAAMAQRDQASATLTIAEGTLKRLRQLHAEGGNVSARAVSEAEAGMLAEQAALQTARAKIADLRAEAIQRWGVELVDAALNDTPWFERLQRREEVILMVTLPPDQALPEDRRRAWVDRQGERTAAREAFLIDVAPTVDATLQGETYFFRTSGHRLRTGTLVDLRIPIADQGLLGVTVPRNAVVWHAGRPWVFVQRDDGGFVRRDLGEAQETTEGWFVSSGLSAGQLVVVSGGQMLLSEEYRWSIPDEDDVP
jgi:hypothetical protein